MNNSLRILLPLFCLSLFISSCSDDDDDNNDSPVGHVYVQTNETANRIIHYQRLDDGILAEQNRYPTQGVGTNGNKPVTGESSAPDPLFSANSLVLSDDNDILFVANGADNTVTSFLIGDDGVPTYADRQLTGENGTVNSLAFDDNTNTLTVSHSFGPNHLKQFNVDESTGELELMDGQYSVNTSAADDRIPTHVAITPDNDFIISVVLFDARPVAGDSGPILTPSNVENKDAFVVFPIQDDGSLGDPMFTDSGTPTPFSIRFLNGSSSQFVCAYAAGNGAGLSTIASDGSITNLDFVEVDLSAAPDGPSETCWISIDNDNDYAYAANFSLGTVSSFSLNSGDISIARETAAEEEGQGFRALAGIPTSGPADSWISDDGYYYQLFGNAEVLVGYKAEDGELSEIGRYQIPLNSTQGMVGF